MMLLAAGIAGDLELWAGVVFIALMTVLSYTAFPTLVSAMKSREAQARDQLAQVAVAEKELRQAREEFIRRGNDAKDAAKRMLEEAERDARRIRSEMVERAKADADRHRQRMERELELARLAAIAEVRDFASRLSLRLAETGLRAQLTSADHLRLLNEAVEAIVRGLSPIDASRQPLPTAGGADLERLGVARPYADALWSLANRRGQAPAVLDELGVLIHQVAKTAGVRRLLESRGISQDQRAAILKKAMGGKVSELVLDFLLTLNRHDRLLVLAEVEFWLHHFQRRAQNEVEVAVRSAAPLGDAFVASLTQRLRSALHAEPRVSVVTNPDLLGGLCVRVGETAHDFTVRARLNRLRDNILAGGVS